jgi:tetratricopeptide (TPR) repeat protein
MCGGNLDVPNGVSVIICDNCGTEQTLSTSGDDIVINLFNRANNLRIKCEFDKAVDAYEKILDIDNTQAEAHWGIVLCKYGVEYVEDTQTGNRHPTCHRTQLESILTDSDYIATLQNADSTAKLVYEIQAKEINDLQRKILDIVKSEKPFDVFICYKEKDENGQKTRDSVIANEIYHELTNSGLKTFYAAITLEDKLGVEYEPYIYAALSSAKVMLVLGTRQEYFNAIWVKNEWSRYLHMMKIDKSQKKTLIPCFRDMDAYDLPDEFSHLQALDMSNIAFMPDLTRNLKKLVGTEQTSAASASSKSDSNAAPLVKRAFLFLEEREISRADELLERALDFDPEYSQAYIGKLMVQKNVRTPDELTKLKIYLRDEDLFKKAIRFADAEYKQTLEQYLYQNHDVWYAEAKEILNSNKFMEAREKFLKIKDHRDSSELANKCLALDTERIYIDAKNTMNGGYYITARGIFESLKGYKDSVELAKKCTALDIDKKYTDAINMMNMGVYLSAREVFLSLKEYKDSAELVKKCIELETEKKYKDTIALMNGGDYIRARNESLSLGNYKDSSELANKCLALDTERIYIDAKRAMESGDYSRAQTLFISLDGYRDSSELAQQCLEPIRKEQCKHVCVSIRSEFDDYLNLLIQNSFIKDNQDNYNYAKNAFTNNYNKAVSSLKEYSKYKDAKDTLSYMHKKRGEYISMSRDHQQASDIGVTVIGMVVVMFIVFAIVMGTQGDGWNIPGWIQVVSVWIGGPICGFILSMPLSWLISLTYNPFK